MTDRSGALIVVLDQDRRVDDLEEILTAIRMIKGVVAVEPQINNGNEFAARIQAKTELWEKIVKAFWPERT